MTREAHKTFQRGDRVRLSDDGRDQHPVLAIANPRGIIVGFGRRRGWIVRVLIDGSLLARPFAARLWEIDPEYAIGKESAGGRG
jgi:hypothetical protein